MELHSCQDPELYRIREVKLLEIEDLFTTGRLALLQTATINNYGEKPFFKTQMASICEKIKNRASQDGKLQTVMTSFFRPKVTASTVQRSCGTETNDADI